MTNMKRQNITLLFPGQGAQYIGMGKDFFENFSIAKETFQEADDSLRMPLSKIMFESDENELSKTENSQPALLVASIAIYRVLKGSIPDVTIKNTAGLSLGEYSALVGANKITFEDSLQLIRRRSLLMDEACKKFPGKMAVILNLENEQVEKMVHDLQLPQDLWVANYNCPGQVVISGTEKGIELGTQAAKQLGAKRVLPLPVQGAFHSGLMSSAENALRPFIQKTVIKDSAIDIAMNVTGNFAKNSQEIKDNLIKQVTGSVRWSQGIKAIEAKGTDLYIEVGAFGKTLCGFNKRIGVKAPTIALETIKDLDQLENINEL